MPPSLPAPPNRTNSVWHALDSADQCVALSELNSEEDSFVLAIADGEVLLAGGRREINPRESEWKEPHGQEKIAAGMQKELRTVIQDKQALKPLSSAETAEIKQCCPDRILESRVVLTEKVEESGNLIVKARWTARGDKDPDLFTLVREGRTQAPTISTNGRYTVLQTIASKRFPLQLGDVTGAFLEANNFNRKQRLFLKAPKNVPMPGYEGYELFEVVKPLYGLNDSPQGWFLTYRDTVKHQGWRQSRLDPCVFQLWDDTKLVGVMGVHVDDVLIGGQGQLFDEKLSLLRSTFPFRKWKTHEGDFCGSHLRQDSETGIIHVSQAEFASKMPKPKLRSRGEGPITKEEGKSLKSVLGSALWLAKETRPDLAVQVSQSQQLLPEPTLKQARTVGNVTRRARQYQNLEWKILPIPFEDLRLCLHSDAAFGNASKNGTQAGYIVGVSNECLRRGEVAPWGAATWKSYRLKRVVGSTFAGESQVLLDGLGHLEWIACHLAEMGNNNFNLANRYKDVAKFQAQAILDCKSIFDHLQSFSSPGSVSDKRVAIDLVIIRETLSRINGTIRWAPTWLQLADALTKENPDAMDILRAAMHVSQYQLCEESVMMNAAAEQRSKRQDRTPKQKEAARKAYEALKKPKETFVSFVLPECRENMVKVSTTGLAEGEVRALFETVTNTWVKDSEEFLACVVQNQTACKIKMPLNKMNSKTFKGVEMKVNLSYTKSTQMIAVSTGAAYLDQAEQQLKDVLGVYRHFIDHRQVLPLPEGSETWSEALGYLRNYGIKSGYLTKTEEEDNDDSMKKSYADMFPDARTKFTPDEEEFRAAIAELAHEASRKLYNYPAWKNQILEYLLQEFDADTDMIRELMSTPEESETSWTEVTDGSSKMSGAKAKSSGYKPKGDVKAEKK